MTRQRALRRSMLAATGMLLCSCATFRVPVEKAVALPSLVSVCPPEREDELCAGLHAAHGTKGEAAVRGLRRAQTAAAQVVGERLRSESTAPWDAALRFYVRERVIGLLVWYRLMRQPDGVQPARSYGDRAAELLARHFPLYARDAFPIALLDFPPQRELEGDCAHGSDLLLILPGVARILSRQEFTTQMRSLTESFPCPTAERVETRSFEDPEVNAIAVRDAVAAHPEARRIHMFGYSQGGLNALAALVAYPEIAARTRTVVFLDVPAHGSEVGQALYDAIRPLGCFHWLWRDKPLPKSVDTSGAAIIGLDPDELQNWLSKEADGVTSVADLFERRMKGIRSLGTDYAEEFWADDGKRVPRTPFFAGFRAIITDTRSNLPISNRFLYRYTRHVARRDPYNDMQVRLASQQLGGDLAEYETLGPVAEGNHWQWAMVPGDVADEIMSTEMVKDMPASEMLLAYYATFSEIGLVGASQ